MSACERDRMKADAARACVRRRRALQGREGGDVCGVDADVEEEK